MDWRDINLENCPVAGAMEVLGDKWTLLIIRDAFNGIKRFEDFQKHLGAPRALLTRRLRSLEEDGVLRRETYQEPGKRQRDQYVLTKKGASLQNILIALHEWGDEYVRGPEGHPLELIDGPSGERVRLAPVRESDNSLVNPRTLEIRPGPGPNLLRKRAE